MWIIIVNKVVVAARGTNPKKRKTATGAKSAPIVVDSDEETRDKTESPQRKVPATSTASASRAAPSVSSSPFG